MKKIFILIFTSTIIWFVIVSLIPMVYYKFNFVNNTQEKYIIEELKKCHKCYNTTDVFSCKRVSGMRIDYVTTEETPGLIKYIISTNNYTNYLMVYRFSKISDTIDRYLATAPSADEYNHSEFDSSLTKLKAESDVVSQMSKWSLASIGHWAEAHKLANEANLFYANGDRQNGRIYARKARKEWSKFELYSDSIRNVK